MSARRAVPRGGRHMVSLLVLSAVLACGGAAEAEETPYYHISPDGQVAVKTVAEWMVGLADPDPAVRRATAWMLQHVWGPEARQMIAPLVRLLDDPVESVRDQVALTLAYVGPDAVPALVEVVHAQGITSGRHDTSVRLQRLAVETIGRLAWRSEDAKQALLDVAQDSRVHPVVRYRAVTGLGGLGTGAPGVAPVLIDLLKRTNEDASIRQGAILTLDRLKLGTDPAVIEALIQTLRDPDLFVRRAAVSTLGRVGPAAKSALPHLQTALTDPDSEVRASAARAIEDISH